MASRRCDSDAFRRRCRRCSIASGGAPPRSSLRELAAGGPGAAFEHARERQVAASPSSARTRGASSSSSATVSARHSTTSSLPTSACAARVGVVAQREHAGVEQQAAVAVLGQAGQRVAARCTATPAHSKGSSSE